MIYKLADKGRKIENKEREREREGAFSLDMNNEIKGFFRNLTPEIMRFSFRDVIERMCPQTCTRRVVNNIPVSITKKSFRQCALSGKLPIFACRITKGKRVFRHA